MLGLGSGVENTTGNNNVCVGLFAGAKNADGNFNVSLGDSALGSKVTGSYNAALGARAAPNLTEGNNNLFLGANVGSTLKTGSGNVLIGAAPGEATMNESIVLSTAGTGAVRLMFNEQGDMQFAVRSLADVANPPAGFVTLARDPATGSIVFKQHT
jgi:hypothetical protein